MENNTDEIRRLNDQLRTKLTGGRLMMTVGIQALGAEKLLRIMREVRSFDAFNEDNDPHHEHDCAVIVIEGERIIWKISYYDKAMEYGSAKPEDPNETTRVLMIMLASEY